MIPVASRAEFERQFATEEACLTYLAQLRVDLDVTVNRNSRSKTRSSHGTEASPGYITYARINKKFVGSRRCYMWPMHLAP